MTEAFRLFIAQFNCLQNDDIKAIENIASISTLKKKEIFIREKEVCNKLIFCAKGYFRFFHFNNEGVEITSDFYFAPNLITSYTSFITGQPSYVNVQAMEDMDVIEIQKHDLDILYQQHKSIERLGRLIAEQVAITSEQHLFSLLNFTAEERYAHLVNQHAHFVQHIPLQYIASYLGITPATLSRVRKKIH